MYIFLIPLVIIAIAVVSIVILNRQFYSQFMKTAKEIRKNAGSQEYITENDLRHLPLPVASYIRASGLVGQKRISCIHIVHSGSFRPGADKSFFPIKGEYFLTTGNPSFCWFGRISLIPGLTISAIDSYYKGAGRMIVKILSFFRIADESSNETGMSAFGRCVAEMTLAPSFFLDKEHITWKGFDSNRVALTITDSGLTTDAQMFFNADGTLDSIEVGRYFDMNNGQFSHEKFTGKGQVIENFNGLRLPSVIDGYWNLKEGDLHYVHFVIEKVEFE
jgi:hypothetical protein